MTQVRHPLFSTGVPQIVPTTGLDILDLRGVRQNTASRLVSLWVNFSAILPNPASSQNLTVWMQEGTGDPVRVTVAPVNQVAGPSQILKDFLLRGNVRLYATAEGVDLVNGQFLVVWGYYTIEGSAPRTAFELRPLQPNPRALPDEPFGMPVVLGWPPVIGDSVQTEILHTVSDTNIDEINIQAHGWPVVEAPIETTALLYFDGTPISAPFSLGPGFISITGVVQAGGPSFPSSIFRTYFDKIPFIGAGRLNAALISNTISILTWFTGSFTRV